MPKKITLMYILHIYIVTIYAYLFLIKKTKHIFFNDTNNVTNIISYNMNSYLFEWHQKYDILITKFVIEYNWKRKNQLFSLYIHTPYTYYIYIYSSAPRFFHWGRRTYYATLKKIIRISVTK